MITWIKINDDTSVNQFLEHGISKQFSEYALDESEHPHIEFDKNNDIYSFILCVPSDLGYPKPMTFFWNREFLIGTYREYHNNIKDELNEILMSETSLEFHSILKIIQFIIDKCMNELQRLSKERIDLTHKLKDQKNSNDKKIANSLYHLLSDSLYLSTATSQNSLALNKLDQLGIQNPDNSYNQINIDSTQLKENAQIDYQLVQQLTDNFNTAINNNLNDIMKLLTIFSVAISLPSLIIGSFSMNSKFPLVQNIYIWILLFIVNFAIGLATYLILKNKL